MKNYTIALFFPKYKFRKIVHVDNVLQIKPIAEEIVYKEEDKSDNFDSNVKVRCIITLLAHYNNSIPEDEFPDILFEIRVNPRQYTKWICNDGFEFFERKHAVEHFFSMLFHAKTFIKIRKRPQPEKPLFNYKRKF